MILSVGCSLAYEVNSPTAHFTFNVLASVGPNQHILDEKIESTPRVPEEHVTSSKGNRVSRLEAMAGPFVLRYAATVEVTRPAPPHEAKPDNVARLPLPILTYLLPSRYCESDRFTSVALELFGKIRDRAAQVRAICEWIDANIAYAPGASDSRTSAWDVWQSRRGVCRDYTHLAIAFCRALSIPARYVGGYAAGLEPMDFHACFESYVGGSWFLFDPTDGIAPDRVVVIARGRDAANAALTTIFGRVTPGPVKVSCLEAPRPAAA